MVCILRACHNENNLAEGSTSLAALACTDILSFRPLLRVECGDGTLFGSILCVQLQLCYVSLILASTAQMFRWLRSITLQLLFSSPMKSGVCTALRWQLGSSVSLVCDAFRVPSLSAPSAGGMPGIETATTFLLTSIYCDDSVYGGLLDKLI